MSLLLRIGRCSHKAWMWRQNVWTNILPHSISIWDSVTKVVPLYSVYQVPSCDPDLRLIAPVLTILVILVLHPLIDAYPCVSNRSKYPKPNPNVCLPSSFYSWTKFWRCLNFKYTYWHPHCPPYNQHRPGFSWHWLPSSQHLASIL